MSSRLLESPPFDLQADREVQPFTVRPVDPLTEPNWDRQVGEFPSSTVFHTSAWARVLHATYDFAPLHFAVFRGARLQAALPVAEVNSWITGRRGSSLPFTDECGVLSVDDIASRQLVEQITAHARARRWRYWELRGASELFRDQPTAETYFGHRLSLQESPMALLAKFDEATRRAIRKAERSGLVVEFSRSEEAVRTFHQLLCQTRKRHGLPPQPLRFFENLHRHLLVPNHGCVVLASHRGVPAAGAVFLHHGPKALYKYGASDQKLQHLRPNNLVMWRAIEWHARAGFESLDFGRTDVGNEGLRRFKLGWGATERVIKYLRYDCRVGAFVAPRARASRWRVALFQRLPQAVSRLIGAVAYRHAA